ncbi:MAG: hypothetical protein OXN90_12255, partial [Gemmatimonadota bacterium]|nr:hypothetical protein [Gemmatimonadota bacterium]
GAAVSGAVVRAGAGYVSAGEGVRTRVRFGGICIASDHSVEFLTLVELVINKIKIYCYGTLRSSCFDQMVEFVVPSLCNDATFCHCKTAFLQKNSNVAHMLL